MTTKSATPRPEDAPISGLQGQRLAALTGLDVESVAGQSLVKLSDTLKWRVDPTLFFFRSICGRVVKTDPVTGVEYGVPFATVYVEDTDCSFISYFPSGARYVWHYPFWCKREVIGQAKTDACGNFCVLVPRFDIDWILRWRLERICFPVIFNRPNLGDLIKDLPPQVIGPVPIGPDPGPLQRLAALSPSVIETLGGSQAARLVRDAGGPTASRPLGALKRPDAEVLGRRLFDRELPPPLPAEFHQALSGHAVHAAKGASAAAGIRGAIAAKVGLDPQREELANFNVQQFIGPFERCFDVFVPEWQLILDVPDITFRVTQDTNGDGTEETIYSEGYFDVRWDAGNLPPVTLVASGIAKESRICEQPPVNCSGIPAILTVGLMTVTDPSYFDASNGFALRPNRPSLDGVNPHPLNTNPPVAQTPFCEALQLYGCVDVGGAKYYRLLLSVDGGSSFSAITGQGWNNYSSIDGHPIPIAADSGGWYDVSPIDPVSHAAVARSSLEFPNMLLDWTAPGGKNIVKIELGDTTRAHLGYSASVPLQVDNGVPVVLFDPSNWLAWKFATENDSQLRVLGRDCPIIQRGAVPLDIEVVFRVTASATHLRDASLWASGCGGGSLFTANADPSNNPSHWYTSAADNSAALYQRYSLSANAKPGCYTFGCTADSRAINPAGSQGENQLPTPDWYANRVYIYTTPSISVAVVNEN